MSKKAVIFFAPGLEECEGLLCVDILRRAGVEVTIAAVGGNQTVTSARQVNIVADALAENVDYSAYDACILPGGIPGVNNLKADATVAKTCRDFAEAGKHRAGFFRRAERQEVHRLPRYGRSPDRGRCRIHRLAPDHRRQHRYR